MQEAWKNIPGYEGYYQASTLGKIRSLDRVVIQPINGQEIRKKLNGKMLKTSKDKDGYLNVTLYIGEKRKTISVHKLVALSFFRVCKEAEVVRHLNGIPDDNRLENLAYGSQSDNILDTYSYGRLWQKLNLEQVSEIRKLIKCGIKQKDIAWLYGVNNSTICDINKGRHFGWHKEVG